MTAQGPAARWPHACVAPAPWPHRSLQHVHPPERTLQLRIMCTGNCPVRRRHPRFRNGSTWASASYHLVLFQLLWLDLSHALAP